NVFMTLAWYGHFRFFKGEGHSIWMIILISWGIAFFEYMLMVPANRLGKTWYNFSTAELKTIQEIITLIVFAAFSVLFLHEKLAWNHIAGFMCIAAAGFFVFNFRPAATKQAVEPPVSPTYTAAETTKE
ncbi:MAG TPA: DMT family protein, partial [Tepidisphaeraceae bacterium]